jgi:hypothetical protein
MFETTNQHRLQDFTDQPMWNYKNSAGSWVHQLMAITSTITTSVESIPNFSNAAFISHSYDRRLREMNLSFYGLYVFILEVIWRFDKTSCDSDAHPRRSSSTSWVTQLEPPQEIFRNGISECGEFMVWKMTGQPPKSRSLSSLSP